MNIILLKKLIKCHPDAYIKISSKTSDEIEYIPIHTDLFNFEHIRIILAIYKTNSFAVEKYNDLPVVFTFLDR